MKEVCQFDLTCPISGVGPEVVRKLLLEENLKIRARKDSKVSRTGATVDLNLPFITFIPSCSSFYVV